MNLDGDQAPGFPGSPTCALDAKKLYGHWPQWHDKATPSDRHRPIDLYKCSLSSRFLPDATRVAHVRVLSLAVGKRPLKEMSDKVRKSVHLFGKDR
jgi:hypothetical protein